MAKFETSKSDVVALEKLAFDNRDCIPVKEVPKSSQKDLSFRKVEPNNGHYFRFDVNKLWGDVKSSHGVEKPHDKNSKKGKEKLS